MKLITPETIQFQASISEDEVRERMALEVLEQFGGLGSDGKPLPKITWSVHRGSGRKGGYVITIAGPAPAKLALPKS